MTKTEWLINVFIPNKIAISMIEEEPPEIDDLIEKIRKGETIHGHSI